MSKSVRSKRHTVERSRLSRRKALIFSIIFTLLILALAEGVFRLANFGGFPVLFRTYLSHSSGARLLRYDSEGMWPYFGQRLAHGGQTRLIGSIVPERVLMPKPPGIVRIFMVGESSVQGFPYPPNLCAASFLEKYLQQSMQDNRGVEVINTGITATASFPLRRVAREICKLEPDVIIVYAGHNEYYGAFGVASAQGVGASTWRMQLAQWWRSTATAQALMAVAEKLGTARSKQMDPQSSETLMELMGTAEVAPDSNLRRSAECTLSSNIDAILSTAQRAHVPVILCSLAANERDLLPVRSIEPRDESQRHEYRAAYKRAYDAISSGPENARPLFEQVAKQFPQSAIVHLYLGRMSELQEDTTTALASYRRARDLDAMPWRATNSINQMLCEKAVAANVAFCDVDGAFHQDASLHGEAAPGWRLFSDHLHPSIEGQALFARALFKTIRERKLLQLTEVEPNREWAELARTMGENRLVDYQVSHLMCSLFQRPPLNGDSSAFRHANKSRANTMRGAADYESRAVNRYLSETFAGKQPWSISFFGGEEALYERQYVAAGNYFDAAMQEAVRFSPERTLAGYYAIYSQALSSGQLTTSSIEVARRRLAEGAYIEKGENDPAIREKLLHALTGLALLSNDSATAQKWAANIPDQLPTAKLVVAEVKEIERLRAVYRAARESSGTRTALVPK